MSSCSTASIKKVLKSLNLDYVQIIADIRADQASARVLLKNSRKYPGMTFSEVLHKDPGYAIWVAKNWDLPEEDMSKIYVILEERKRAKEEKLSELIGGGARTIDEEVSVSVKKTSLKRKGSEMEIDGEPDGDVETVHTSKRSRKVTIN